MVATERIAARSSAGRADRARIHGLPRDRVRPGLRRRQDRRDREGAAVDGLAGCVSDDLPLHPVLHDALHNLAARGGFMRRAIASLLLTLAIAAPLAAQSV